MKSDCYVIQVFSGEENKLVNKINQVVDNELFDDVFVPMIESVYRKQNESWTRVSVMFPGYVFVVTHNPQLFLEELRKIPSFTRLITDEDAYAIPITVDEKKLIYDLINDEDVASMSQGYIEGDRVFVTNGPLVGKEGFIKKIDRHKRIAMVEIDMAGRKCQIRMPLEIVYKN